MSQMSILAFCARCRKSRCTALLTFALVLLLLIQAYHFNGHTQLKNEPSKASYNGTTSPMVLQDDVISPNSVGRNMTSYAVYSISTPTGRSHRSFDYAFYLPLTALAWERIGFRSIILIIGERCEWDSNPALSLILERLKHRMATVVFVKTPLEYRTSMSQISRIFVTNLEEFPGKANDYVITSDADLWPLRKEHFLSRPSKDVVLVHSQCCGNFQHLNKTYWMYPMSNIGATVSAWFQIVNDRSNQEKQATDAMSIINYVNSVFQHSGFMKEPTFETAEWFLDQKLVSILLAEWMERYGNESVYRVPEEHYIRVDRIFWDPELFDRANFETRFDAHLPFKPYLPIEWRRIRPLINLMYGNSSWQATWADSYAEQFYAKLHNYVLFTNLTGTNS